ncbi:MAG: hypothetical protein ACKOZM_00965, partial [Flavobacteriales bacterium]
MKRILLSAFALCSFFAATAQCNPSDHDFGDVEYGVYPDVASGLAAGCLNEPYSQTIYFLVPSDAGAIDPAYAGIPVTSITLDGITYNGGTDITALGLELACNPANCSFAAGSQYCGTVSGVPNQVGDFPVSIDVTVSASLAGFPLELPYSFPGYTFVVSDCANPNSVAEVESTFALGAVSPNPANQNARIAFSLGNNDRVELTVVNMVGERVLTKTMTGKRGENFMNLDV